MSSSPQGHLSQASASSGSIHSMPPPHQELSLETLVSYLLASKRSLASINTVWRANELVQTSRSALVESVVLSARTGFLQSGISEQVKILRKVKGGIDNEYKEGQREFKAVIRTLDAANARLESTMETLRSTMVEAAFRPDGEDPRSLLDFVDEQGVEGMRDALKESINESREAQTEFDTAILSFDDDMRALKMAMTTPPKVSPAQSHSDILDGESPIPADLQELEVHAQDMAHLLESLVNHFDLCVNAIRHTDGGFAAFRQAASNPPPGAEPVSVSGVMNPETEAADEPPISDEERLEMLGVLENDAAQVEDVVMELRDHLAEMEVKHEAILQHVSYLKIAYTATTAAYVTLESIGSRLPTYILAAQEFRAHWEEIKEVMAAQMEELEHMRVFYENYHSSYDGLILEVSRRKTSEDRVKSILKKALDQVAKVCEADTAERAAFREDVGDFLPVDLYPRLVDLPPKWAVQVLGKSGSSGAEGVDGSLAVSGTPSLPGAVIEAADRRARERRRAGAHAQR
ncbi:kinase activator [Phlyctema vagabunda]|uniref:Autophagy-related protein 17 n=1 Tax=Phlyctema vagabunda TaxID=108571 RepID=A0ABR4P286_9HELO